MIRSPHRDWHIVTCEFPPAVGGVADYTARIAGALARSGQQVHVWAPGVQEDEVLPNGVRLHRRLGRFSIADCARVGRMLNAARPRRLLVQWVPHGYGYKSLNLPFACWLAWRALVRDDEIQLMVHEPYMRVTWPPTHVVASSIEKAMLWVVGMVATRTWLSTPSWQPWVMPFVRASSVAQWLPVPAPEYGDDVRTPGMLQPHADAAPVIGHFSTHSTVVTAVLGPALERILARHGTVRVLLMGRDSERFRQQLIDTVPEWSMRVHALGVLAIDDVVAAMRTCDLMLQPYPDGVTTRNTSTLLALSAGVCVVSNRGPLTEPLWTSSPAVELAPHADASSIADTTLALLDDPDRRQKVAAAGSRLYQDVFDVRHAAAMLIASTRTDSPATQVPSHAEA